MRHKEEADVNSSRLRPLAAFAGVVAIIAAACGSGATPSPSASAAPSAAAPSAAGSAAASGSAAAADLNIVFIPKAINNPYFDAAKAGAEKAAGELGGKMTQIGSQNATAAEQIPFIQDATTQGFKAIAVSATGADEVAPALKAAKDAGIKVVGYDSSPAEGAYDVFVNQTDFSLIGGSMAQWACDLAPDCTGDIAILSATATATNQNAWIADFNEALKDPKFANLKLVDTVYGDDDATKSTNEANGLLQKWPNLKVIVAPTTVGILAAAQVVKQAGSAVKVTGLGLPNDMKSFVADGTTPEFGLWSVPDLGYLTYYIAAKLLTGEITGAPGETFTVPGLNDDKPYTIGDKSVVILGPPFVFNKDNVDQFDF
jgi:rhamnose transport system substrate-binding protein